MASTDDGSETDRSEQRDNLDSPRVETWPPGSNVNFERRGQCSKQKLEMILVDEGIQIDSSDEQSVNADSLRIEI
jgi:hypothetical protein